MVPEWHDGVLSWLGRLGLSLAAIVALLLLSALPLQIVHLGGIRPSFMLMAVYYWTILRPTAASPFTAFTLGIILDLVSAYPLGSNALIFVAVQWLTVSQRKFLAGQSFLVIWAGFALTALFGAAVHWALFWLFTLERPPLEPVGISVLISILLFPVLVLPLAILSKALSDDPSAQI